MASLWWIDLRDAAAPVRLAFLAATGIAFLAWGLRRVPGPRMRAVVGILALAVALVAVRDTTVALGAVASGLVRVAVPVTVPAPEAQPIVELPLFVAREVPAFWSYLLRVALL